MTGSTCWSGSRPSSRRPRPPPPGGWRAAGPSPHPTGPAGPTGPPPPIGAGLLGLPPEGATPSSPEHGELVLSIGFGHTDGDFGRFSLDLYADGRVIWQRRGYPPGGEYRGSTG